MKKLIYILCLSMSFSAINAQVNPVCDEVLEIPYSFSYSGFILFEDYGEVNTNGFQLRISIAESNPDGNILFTENHTVAFQKNGFFNVDIGSKERDDFNSLIVKMNESSLTEYFIVVELFKGGGYVTIGSKLIQTVPYALVANSLGGIGARGPKGDDGQGGAPGINGTNGVNGLDGAPGAPGQNGLNGQDGFGIMIMTSSPPGNRNLYVDDGTNTADGKPHLRHKNANGVWIDL